MKKKTGIQRKFYLEKLETFGPESSLSVGWPSSLQASLFLIISSILNSTDKDVKYSLLDVGSGLGDFITILEELSLTNIEYTGIEIIPELLKISKKRHHGYNFLNMDFMSKNFNESFDFIICSGAMNIINTEQRNDHINYIEDFITKMYNLSKKASAFNLLSKSGEDYIEDDDIFFYTDPEYILNFCRTLDKEAELKHDYFDYIFTVFMKSKENLH